MMDKTEFDFDKTIDPGQLDVEAIRQAEIFFKWSEKAVAARAEADRQKFALDVLTAKTEALVRDNPSSYGIGKVTEAAILSAVKIHASVVEATTLWLHARQVAALLDRAVEALEQKKRMIEVLINLHGQQYFAGPSVPRNIVEAWKNYSDMVEVNTTERQALLARHRTRERTDE